MTRSDKYYVEIFNEFSGMDLDHNMEMSDLTLQVRLKMQSETVSVYCLFFSDTMMTLIKHSRPLDASSRMSAAKVLGEYNACIGCRDAYGISEDGELSFTTGYGFRYPDPQSDPGLHGFCKLIFKTIPRRLDDISEVFRPNVAGIKETGKDKRERN